MIARIKRAAGAGALMALAAFVCVPQFGCGGSPFLAAQFASNFTPSRLGPPAGGGGPNVPPTDTTVLASVCDLTGAASQVINVSIQNQAQQRVRFAINFVVSAGTGGFVCDTLLQNYLNAGYTDAFAPGSASSLMIGCDTVTLNSGNRILRLRFGADVEPFCSTNQFLPPNTAGTGGGNPPTLELRQRGLTDPCGVSPTASNLIPIPEIIVFGTSSEFQCLGDLCSQRGFIYTNASGVATGKAPDADHIQGTLCQTGFGTAPEWRLDKTLNDGGVLPFQYPVGATIVVQVLDRSTDSLDNTRNQVVWTVTSVDNVAVHNPQP